MNAPTLLAMAFDRATALAKIRGREQTINEHLTKLCAFTAPETMRAFWKKELVRKHFAILAAMRLKPDARPVPADIFRDLLYAEPFEGNEAAYMAALIRMAEPDLARNAVPVADLAAAIARFHAAAAPLLSAGEDCEALVDAL